ncbi:ABC transporter permease [Methylocella sp. CPCC 101449]|uniref:ABC transporter permease n=1 Tax=Methylocella sp. CPCC 101449 TaxID=2987531 RepID=UPI0028901CE6|nr:ABC transporter permease [Methylocella sp. CPCC 101449]MDT2022162.1 ABC transporter permease [Methylocella sp. CPCC 101449]HEV2573113.1 ABC transporter permease [Beijerinckiaceae bacterium]
MSEVQAVSAIHVPAPMSDADLRKRERIRRKRLRSTIENLAAPALALALLLAWQIAVPLFNVSEFVLPTPFDILKRTVTDYRLLLSHCWVTAAEVVAGFLCAATVGILTALAVFYSRIVERAVYPLLVAMQTVPKVALAPLVILYLGYDWGPKLFLSFLISFFPIVVATVVGLKSLDRGYANLVKSMGASEAQVFLKVRLPAALPSIFGSFKVALSLAVIGAVLGEYVAAERGLGYLQLQANANFDVTLNFAAVFVIALLGVSLYSIILFVEKKINTQHGARP